MMSIRTFTVTTLLLVVVLLPSRAPAHPSSGHAIVYRASLACAAFARIQAARFPDALRLFDDWRSVEDFAQAERALHGLDWRRRAHYARLVAQQAFAQLRGRSPTIEDCDDALSRWTQRLQSYSAVMREAVGQNCHPLFEQADRWARQHRAPIPGL